MNQSKHLYSAIYCNLNESGQNLYQQNKKIKLKKVSYIKSNCAASVSLTYKMCSFAIKTYLNTYKYSTKYIQI